MRGSDSLWQYFGIIVIYKHSAHMQTRKRRIRLDRVYVVRTSLSVSYSHCDIVSTVCCYCNIKIKNILPKVRWLLYQFKKILLLKTNNKKKTFKHSKTNLVTRLNSETFKKCLGAKEKKSCQLSRLLKAFQIVKTPEVPKNLKKKDPFLRDLQSF